jgi:hypothetical protein
MKDPHAESNARVSISAELGGTLPAAWYFGSFRSRSILLIAFAFAIMADPVSSVAYTAWQCGYSVACTARPKV